MGNAYKLLVCVLVLLVCADCSLTAYDIRYSHPDIPLIQICDKPLDVPFEVNLWGYNAFTRRLVTADEPSELRRFDSATAFFEYNPDAPESSALEMPAEYGLKCPKLSKAFPDAPPILPPAIDWFRGKEPCHDKLAERIDPRWIGQTTSGNAPCAPKKTPQRALVCVRPPGVPSDAAEWARGASLKGKRLTFNVTEYVKAAAEADIIFVYDENAPPETIYYFEIDPTKLSCPGKPPPRPYKDVVASGSLPVLNLATSMASALSTTPKKGNGQTTSTSSPDGEGPPLSFSEILARNLSIMGALASGDTSGSLKDPNGARYGMVGGKNPDGPNLQILQIAAGTFAILGLPLKTGRDFIMKITTALGQRKVVVILDVRVLSKEIANKLAQEPSKEAIRDAIEAIKRGEEVTLESFGMAMAMSLREAQVILPYSRAQIFTAGWEAKYQAHHIFEVQWMEKLDLGDMAKDAPAVILSKAEHEVITTKLAAARKKLLDNFKRMYDGRKPGKPDVWAMYQEVYKDQPNWLKAIEHYFK